jgi:hypothetical protein
MGQKTDWLAGTREAQLAMAKDWKIVMTVNAKAWGIPSAALTELEARSGKRT